MAKAKAKNPSNSVVYILSVDLLARLESSISSGFDDFAFYI